MATNRASPIQLVFLAQGNRRIPLVLPLPLIGICLSHQHVHINVGLAALHFLLVLSPSIHALLHSVHPLAVLLNVLQRLLPLLFELFLISARRFYAFFVSPLVELVVLLHLPPALLVLREDAHDLLLDGVLLLPITRFAHRNLRQRVGIHSLADQPLVVLDHALRRALDELHAVLLLLRVLRLAAFARAHFQLRVRCDHRFVGFARAGMAAFIGVKHRRELQIALANVLVRGRFGEHQHAVGVQILPLGVETDCRAYESVLSGETLHVLNGGHVDDSVVRYAAILLRVDHRLEVLVDRRVELLQLLVLADRAKPAEAVFDRRVVVRHGFRLLEGAEVLAFLG